MDDLVSFLVALIEVIVALMNFQAQTTITNNNLSKTPDRLIYDQCKKVVKNLLELV